MRWLHGFELLDQTKLPATEVWLRIEDVPQLVEAIECLAVRGAPALGCAAAYGMALAGQTASAATDWLTTLDKAGRELAAARPTAVNLQVGVDHQLAAARDLLPQAVTDLSRAKLGLLQSARDFHQRDADLCAAIGNHGQELLKANTCVLTHCNAGSLATGGSGTALAVIYAAHNADKRIRVLVDETRPLLQGSRLSCWELTRAGIAATLQCDGAAASAFSTGLVDAVIVGADRIAANGDVANKIGTYGIAVLAEKHGVPFYVAAPTTTIDLNCATGADIPIEQRSADEVLYYGGRLIAPEGIAVRNPAFDITPAVMVSAIITERGVLPKPTRAGLEAHTSANCG
jgi:methylthioribose-1-phosphate isomerase